MAQVFAIFMPGTYAQGQTDLSVTNIVNNGIVTPLSDIGFQYIYSNTTAPHTGATNVTITVTLSDGLVPDSSTPNWDSQSGNNYYYEIEDGTTDAVIRFIAKTNGPTNGIYYSTVSVSGDQPDPDMSNNTDTGFVLVVDDVNQQVDLAIDASFTWSLFPGWDVEYVINYANTWDTTAYGVDIFTFLSEGLQDIVSSTAATSISWSLYRWNIGDLAAGATGTITIDAAISPLVESWYALTFQSEIDGILEDSNTEDNSITLDHTVVESVVEPDVTILWSTWSLCVWSSYDMTIIRQNVSHIVQDLHIDVIIPSQMSFQNGDGDHTLVSTGVYRWDVNGGDIGVLDFSIVPTQVANNVSIQTYISDEAETIYAQESASFDIITCTPNDPHFGDGEDDHQPEKIDRTRDIHHAPTDEESDTDENIETSEQALIKKITCIQWAQEIYTYARDIWITTINTIQDARLCDPVMRIELAKMLAVYAQTQLQLEPNTERTCIFGDLDGIPAMDQEYATLACQLGLMWLHADGAANTTFNPYATVTRDVFATAFSRMLFREKFNNKVCWYCSHISALKKAGIIKYTDPSTIELRWYVMTTMYRTVDFISRVMNR